MVCFKSHPSETCCVSLVPFCLGSGLWPSRETPTSHVAVGWEDGCVSLWRRTNGQGMRTYNIRNDARRTTRHRAFLDNDSARLGILCNGPRRRLERAEIGARARAHAVRLGRRVDANKDDVGGRDAGDHVGREEEIGLPRREVHARLGEPRQRPRRGVRAVARDAHNLGQALFVDRQVVRVPRCDAVVVEVDDVDCDGRVVVGDQRRGGTPCCSLSVKCCVFREGERPMDVPTKPAPTKQMLWTGAAAGSPVMVLDRAWRLAPPGLGAGDSPRELGGEVAGVASSDSHLSSVVASESVLTSRTKGGMCMWVGYVVAMVTAKKRGAAACLRAWVQRVTNNERQTNERQNE